MDSAYVFAVPDERTGEAAHAFVMPARGRTLDHDALRLAVQRKLDEAAVPLTITALDAIPVTAAGQPDKREPLSLMDTG